MIPRQAAVSSFERLPERAQRHQGNPVAAITLGLQQVEAAAKRLADCRLRLRIVGDGMAGPPAHMIAFQASHSSRSTSRIFASAALRISTECWRATRAHAGCSSPAPCGRRRTTGCG
jgi:hypothetical protein